jgi:hypothetical protein
MPASKLWEILEVKLSLYNFELYYLLAEYWVVIIKSISKDPIKNTEKFIEDNFNRINS